MAENGNQRISFKFVFFLSIFIIGYIIYLATPDEIGKITKKRSYKESLEYNSSHRRSAVSVEQVQETRPEEINTQTEEPIYEEETTPVEENSIQTEIKEKKLSYNEDPKFLDLLDELKVHPAMSISSAEIITREILKYKGFLPNSVTVVEDVMEGKNKSIQGSYVAATFNVQTGKMHINTKALYNKKIEEIIAVIAHELDHFEKDAQICKSMGTANYIKLLNDNNIKNIDFQFWENAQQYANIDDFDAQYYKDALVRYTNQNKIDLTSTYSDLYRLSEHMRNPLEVSAYEVSDFVLGYYNYNMEDGPLKKMTLKFNEVDWAIHNLIKDNELLKDERIAFFDYFFAQAILSTYPKYTENYKNCIKSGNLSQFWIEFEKDHEKFYSSKENLDGYTYTSIINLLDKVNELAKNRLNKNIICDALKYKTNTLLHNIVFPNAIFYIEESAKDYLTFIKTNNINNPEEELKMILTLLCIENGFTKSEADKEISLFYIKFPQIIEHLYNIEEKSKRYHFIYQNEAFKKIHQERKTQKPSTTEQETLINLLNENRLNVKIKI